MALGLEPDADLVVQFAEGGDQQLPGPLQAIRAPRTAD
jgi:hypothetical protein